jgi:hypothetical protein
MFGRLTFDVHGRSLRSGGEMPSAIGRAALTQIVLEW